MEVERSQGGMLLDEGMREAELLLQSIICTKRRISSTAVAMDCLSKARPAKKRRSSRQAKQVRFAEADSVRYIAEANGGDFRTCWYQQDEYKRIKEGNQETLRAIYRACGKIADIDASEHCTRGLELQIRVLLLQLPYDDRPKKVVQSVLSMQHTQRKLCRNDMAATLREMSLIVSKPDKLKAWRTALLDSQI